MARQLSTPCTGAFTLGAFALGTLAFAALFASACDGGQSGAEVTEGVGGSQSNPGAVECEVTEDCREQAVAEIQALAQPSSQVYATVRAECSLINAITDSGSASGPACSCDYGAQGTWLVGPAGAGCYRRGRSGDCLLGEAEFSGCDLEDASSCDAVCAELAERATADAARSFDVKLEYVACEQNHCRRVISIDGRCYADQSYQEGRDYDCARGPRAILDARASESAGPPALPQLMQTTPYADGSSAFVELSVNRDFAGTTQLSQSFGAYAQFFDPIAGTSTQSGEVIDPLDGIDDCGVVRLGSMGTAPIIRLRDVERAVLRDGTAQYPLEEFRSSSTDYYSYILDLAPLGVAPRFGQSYGFSASGGGFGADIALDITLPEELRVPTFEAQSRFERGALSLIWSGRGQAPLQLSIGINDKLSDYATPYGITCLMADDGEFTIPESVLAAAPDGFATIGLTREVAARVATGGRSVATYARSSVGHRVAFGPACDGSAIAAACRTSAESMRAAYVACNVEPPPLEYWCPDYLAQTCLGCPEYFECMARNTRCDSAGLASSYGCSCP